MCELNFKYHYLYKIENNITNEYYYGVHSTNDLNDSYFGSGSELAKNIKKYGKQNFTKTILEFFPSRKELMKAEEQLVDKTTLADPLCLNVIIGGGEIRGSVGKKCVIDENGVFRMIDKSNNDYTPFMKGRICMNKGGKITYIYESSLQKYLDEGWVRGTIYDSPGKNKIWVCKKEDNMDEIQRRQIDPDDLQKYLDDGWIRGTKFDRDLKCTYVNKNGVIKYIELTDLQKYLDEGWARGTNVSTVGGRLQVMKGEEIKYINKDDLQKYLDDGWKHESKVRDSVWVNKGNINKRIGKNDLQKYLDDGWKHGRKNHKIHKRMTDHRYVKVKKNNLIEKIDLLNLQKYLEEGWELCNKYKKLRYISKNGISLIVYIDDLQKYLGDGWSLDENQKHTDDRGKYKGSIWIYKGNITKRICPEDMQKYLDEGWEQGRSPRIKKIKI